MFDYVGNVGALTPQRGREKLEQRQLSRPSKTDSMIPPTKTHLPHSFNIISAKTYPAMFDYVGNVGALTPQRGREKLEQRQLSRPSKTDLT